MDVLKKPFNCHYSISVTGASQSTREMTPWPRVGTVSSLVASVTGAEGNRGDSFGFDNHSHSCVF